MKEAEEIIAGMFSQALAEDSKYNIAEKEYIRSRKKQNLLRPFRRIRQDLRIAALATGVDFRRVVAKMDPTDVVTIAAGSVVGALASPSHRGSSGRLENSLGGAVMGMAASIYLRSIKDRR